MLLKSSGAKKGETMESRRQETGVAGCSLTRLLGPSVPLGNKGGWRALFLLLFSKMDLSYYLCVTRLTIASVMRATYCLLSHRYLRSAVPLRRREAASFQTAALLTKPRYISFCINTNIDAALESSGLCGLTR